MASDQPANAEPNLGITEPFIDHGPSRPTEDYKHSVWLDENWGVLADIPSDLLDQIDT